MFRKKWPWVVGAAGGRSAWPGGAYSRSRQEKGTLVTAENVQRRDLEALVSASGKIEPKRSVNISAQSMGRVTRIGVREGDRVDGGPVPAADRPGRGAERGAPRRSRRRRGAHRPGAGAGAGAERAGQPRRRPPGAQASAGAVGGRADHPRDAREGRSRGAGARERHQRPRPGNPHPRGAGPPAGGRARQHAATTCRRSRFESPFDGIVTRRNIEEGENVVVGTMNNAGTVLLTVADMSVIEAEVEVDETDIPLVQIGQKATVTIDAIDGKTFTGRGDRDRQQPDPGHRPGPPAQRTATNFKVVVTLDEAAPEIRPGFTCTAEISTATQVKRGRGADPGADRARARVRHGRRGRAEAAAGAAVALVSFGGARPRPRPGRPGRTAGRPHPQGDRGRVRHPRRQGACSCRSRSASPASDTSR